MMKQPDGREQGMGYEKRTLTLDQFMPNLTQHASLRMGSRRISLSDIAVVMSYGRSFHVRGAVVYAMGRREMASCESDGIRPEGIRGLQVICAPDSDEVITVYRNSDFRRLKRRHTRGTPACVARS